MATKKAKNKVKKVKAKTNTKKVKKTAVKREKKIVIDTNKLLKLEEARKYVIDVAGEKGLEVFIIKPIKEFSYRVCLLKFKLFCK